MKPNGQGQFIYWACFAVCVKYLSCPQQSSSKQSLLLNDSWKDWKEPFLVELDAADAASVKYLISWWFCLVVVFSH